ncbi:dihydrofolate reductase family protein [Knoellia sp. S7-12]|uniref:dihydrofolate reductase family protein n=1 Tax=Knoellia sp. S7-12 TaxID=3126698 RepID=UPI003366F9F7
MRKVVVTNIISLDGAFSGAGGDVMAMPFDEGFDVYIAERLAAAETVLLGAVSYREFLTFWPSVVDDENSPQIERDFSRAYNEVDKLVVSDTLRPEETGAWASTTTIIPRSQAHDEVAELRRGNGGEIVIYGSHVLWNDLLAHGLVDELHLMVGPAVIGGTGRPAGGVPAFQDCEPARFELLEVREFEASGIVLLRYATQLTA